MKTNLHPAAFPPTRHQAEHKVRPYRNARGGAIWHRFLRQPNVPRSAKRLFLRLTVGSVLCTSFALKLVDYAFADPGGTASVMLLGLLAVEGALGIWLIWGWYSRISVFAAALLFSAFWGASFHGFLRAEPTCGCFGSYVPLRPYWSMLLSGSVAILCAVFTFAGGTEPGDSFRVLRPTAISLCAAAFVGYSAANSFAPLLLKQPATVTSSTAHGLADRENSRHGIKDINIPVDLRSGRWCVVFFNLDCPTCRASLPRLLSLSEGRSRWSNSRLAFVEVPPFHPERLWTLFGTTGAPLGQMGSGQPLPGTVVLLRRGKPIKVIGASDVDPLFQPNP